MIFDIFLENYHVFIIQENMIKYRSFFLYQMNVALNYCYISAFLYLWTFYIFSRAAH